MAYLGFGSLSGTIHLLARLSIGRGAIAVVTLLLILCH
jgi:hypothetical protein